MYERKIKYTTVSISEPFMNKIKDFIGNNEKYISCGDFIREAIREKMNRELVK